MDMPDPLLAVLEALTCLYLAGTAVGFLGIAVQVARAPLTNNPLRIFSLAPFVALLLASAAIWNWIGLHTDAGTALIALPGLAFSASPIFFYFAWMLFWLLNLRVAMMRLEKQRRNAIPPAETHST